MKDFIFSNDFYKSIDLMLYTSGHEKCKPSHSYGPAVRASYMIHYVHSGKGIYQTGGKTYHLGPGDIFLMEPGKLIYYEADEKDPWVYSWIGLQGIKTEEYLNRTNLLLRPVCHLPESSKIPELYDQLLSVSESDQSDLLCNAIAYQFIYELSLADPVIKKKETPTPNEYVEMILTYIERHFDEQITVNQISEKFNLDRSYIHRIFKRVMNMSVKDYILSLRLANACSYLIHTDLSISEISRSVGYDDVLYFSRLFRKKKGESPTQYRARKALPADQLHRLRASAENMPFVDEQELSEDKNHSSSPE